VNRQGSSAFALLGLLTMAACSGFRPGFEVVSPDGRLVASFYGIYGGGGPGWEIQAVSIRHTLGSRPTRETWELHENRVAKWDNAEDVCLKWTGPSSLVITHSPDADVAWRLDSISIPEVVLVSYELSPPVTIEQAERAGARCGRIDDGKRPGSERT
jgi:hypothetical protein